MSALRRLAESIGIEIVGFAEADAFIDEFLDTDDHSSNTWYHPGNLFSLSGNKIKIDGDAPGVGMFFVPEDGSPEVKVERLNENGPASLRGIIPNCDAERCKIEIRTQFSGANGRPLKTIRVIKSSFSLERA